MKKLLLSMFFMLILFMGFFPIKAMAADVGDAFYTDMDGSNASDSSPDKHLKMVITADAQVSVAAIEEKRNDFTGEYTIPQSVTYDGVSYNVTSLADNAFENCDNLTSVTIPEGVSKIGDKTFRTTGSGTKNLENVTIPSSVAEIGKYAFENQSALQSIVIPEGVTEIKNHTFNNCTNLSNVTLPESLARICDNAFAECANLENIVLPDGLKSIGQYAFQHCKLSDLVLPDGIEEICESVFSKCPLSRSITLPSNLKLLGGSFAYMSGAYNFTFQVGQPIEFRNGDPFYGSKIQTTRSDASILLVSTQGGAQKETVFGNMYDLINNNSGERDYTERIYCASYNAENGLNVTTTTDATNADPVLICEITGADKVYVKINGKITGIDSVDGKCTYRITTVKYKSSDEVVPVIFTTEGEGNTSGSSRVNAGDGSDSGVSYDYLEELRILLKNAIAKGGTQTIEWNKGTVLTYDIMKTLEEHPNLTLIFSYTWKGVNYKVTLSGKSVKAFTNIPYYGPAYLYKFYGNNMAVTGASATEGSRTYTVEKGDTLSGLAVKLHTTVAKLVSLNKISNPDRIREGQLLTY